MGANQILPPRSFDQSTRHWLAASPDAAEWQSHYKSRKKDQKVHQANQRPTSERKTWLHHQGTQKTEKKIESLEVDRCRE